MRRNRTTEQLEQGKRMQCVNVLLESMLYRALFTSMDATGPSRLIQLSRLSVHPVGTFPDARIVLVTNESVLPEFETLSNNPHQTRTDQWRNRN